MGRTEKCGAAVVLPTAPAYSFGLKYPRELISPGPGSARYSDQDDPLHTRWSGKTTAFAGRPIKNPEFQDSSAPLTDTYLHPGYLSTERKGPSYGFGLPYKKAVNSNPGAGSYSPYTNNLFQPWRRPHSGWGPPPVVRPRSAPPPPPEPTDRRRPKYNSQLPGATIKFPLGGVKPDVTPGPSQYHPCDCDMNSAACCDMCQKYRGYSFGIRHRPWKPEVVPGPKYHTDCSTLGAASAGCSSSNSSGTSRGRATFRPASASRTDSRDIIVPRIRRPMSSAR